MDPTTVELIDLFVSLGESFLGKLQNKVPAELLASAQAAFDAFATHKDDELTKANFEAQRG